MKIMAMDKASALRIIFVAAMLILLYVAGPEDAWSVGTSVVIVFLMMTYLRTKYPERYQKDERTAKIGAWAASYSWMTTFLVVAALYWLNYLGYFNMPASVVLGAIFALMAATIIGFRWMLSGKGDVI